MLIAFRHRALEIIDAPIFPIVQAMLAGQQPGILAVLYGFGAVMRKDRRHFVPAGVQDGIGTLLKIGFLVSPQPFAVNDVA
jgi:hypothetical protein